MYIKPVESVDEKIIEKEWDDVAEIRDKFIQRGEDISLLDVTEPFIMKCIGDNDAKTALDCGCGTGHLSYLISQKLGKIVTGIDISSKCINRAEANYNDIPNLKFIRRSIIQHTDYKIKYEMCFANMVLMDLTDLKSNVESINKMLCLNGFFYFTITHPCFWPIYWDYFNQDWFEYNSEIYIKAPLQIRNNIVGYTTHIHRPLSNYINICLKAGFTIIKIEELFPISSHLELDYKYDYPRFIGVICKKNKDLFKDI